MPTTTSAPVENATPAPSTGAAPRRQAWRNRLSRWDFKLSPYLYVAPFFLVFLVIGLYPMLYTGYLSFFSWPAYGSEVGPWVGWDNYAHVLGDSVFRKAFWNTIGIFLLSSVPQIIVATILAALLDTRLRGRTLWRMSILLPFVVAPAASAMIFGAIFADGTGLINQTLDGFGFAKVPWHADRFASWTAIATMVNWRWTGYNALIILAAMQAIPRDLYEAAEIDGASKVKQFFHVTLPSIRPTMIFVIVTSTIGGLQIFTEPRIFDTNLRFQGGSDFQYTTLTMYVFNTAQTTTNPYPRAAAAAWVLFLIIVGIALVNFLVTRAVQRRSLR